MVSLGIIVEIIKVRKSLSVGIELVLIEKAMLTGKIVCTIKGDGESPCVNISWIIHFGIGRL